MTGAASKHELGGDRHLGVGLAREGGLGAEGGQADGVAAVGVDVAVALRVAGDVQVGEAVGVEAAGAEELQRLVIGAARAVDAAGDHQRLADADVGVGGDAGVEFGRGGDAAGREVRHDGEALVDQAAGGGEHVGEVGAVDVGEVDAGAGGQDGAEVVDLGGGARHHLDGEVLEQRRDRGGARVAAGAVGRRTKSRIFAIRVLRRVRVSGWPSRRWRSGP